MVGELMRVELAPGSSLGPLRLGSHLNDILLDTIPSYFPGLPPGGISLSHTASGGGSSNGNRSSNGNSVGNKDVSGDGDCDGNGDDVGGEPDICVVVPSAGLVLRFTQGTQVLHMVELLANVARDSTVTWPLVATVGGMDILGGKAVPATAAALAGVFGAGRPGAAKPFPQAASTTPTISSTITATATATASTSTAAKTSSSSSSSSSSSGLTSASTSDAVFFSPVSTPLRLECSDGVCFGFDGHGRCVRVTVHLGGGDPRVSSRSALRMARVVSAKVSLGGGTGPMVEFFPSSVLRSRNGSGGNVNVNGDAGSNAGGVSAAPGVSLSSGSTAQDIVSALGPPRSVFPRLDPTGQSRSPTRDVYYNYPSLGVDVLVDGSMHVAKRVVFHGNWPSDPRFGSHVRCHWSLGEGFGLDGHGALSAWSQIVAAVGTGGVEGPLQRGAAAAGAAPASGTTQLYTARGLVFEVLPSGHIASLTIHLS